MRKHGWQLPYHPLQVVAVAVFLALGFAFYVFFAPFLGKRSFQYTVMAIYTPLLVSSFGLYMWCAAADPVDSGVFKSKKYQKSHDPKLSCGNSKRDASCSSIQDSTTLGNEAESKKNPYPQKGSNIFLSPCACFCNVGNKESSDQHSEEGMFFCSLCEVEVLKYSKHCRVCDKCVDRFDHHCRWLNNCIGRKNYRKFFALMVSALLLLILQWSMGIVVIVLCFLEKKRFAAAISSKLGSSFTVVPYAVVVGVCTVLAMVATLPIAQLFCFHILLIKKGISTYDYIIALREQEQQGVGCHQSAQMSPLSSATGLSSTSSFNTFNRAAWCTPPRLFVEDQMDVVPDNGSVSSLGKRVVVADESMKKKKMINPPAAPVKISPWTLARLNAEDVAKAAAEARKNSKTRHAVPRAGGGARHFETIGSSSSSRRMGSEDVNRSRRIRLPTDASFEHQRTKFPVSSNHRSSGLRIERSIPIPSGSSPESSSLDSVELDNRFCASSSAHDESRRLAAVAAAMGGRGNDDDGNIALSRSTSGGYDASGGEDSDRIVVPAARFLNRSGDWSRILFESNRTDQL